MKNFISLSFLLAAVVSMPSSFADSDSAGDSPAVRKLHSSIVGISLRWQAVHFARFQSDLIKRTDVGIDDTQGYFAGLSEQDQKRFKRLGIAASQLNEEITLQDLQEVTFSNTQCSVTEAASELTSFQVSATCESTLSTGAKLVVNFMPSQKMGSEQFESLTDRDQFMWLYKGVVELPVQVTTSISVY